MFYSDVLESFYRIRLTVDDAEWVNNFFTGAAHSYHRAREAFVNGDRWNAEFHRGMVIKHLIALKAVVYERGDFKSSIDPSRIGMQFRSSWNPINQRLLPDAKMFNSFHPDERYGIGDDHPADKFLVVDLAHQTNRSRAVS